MVRTNKKTPSMLLIIARFRANWGSAREIQLYVFYLHWILPVDEGNPEPRPKIIFYKNHIFLCFHQLFFFTRMLKNRSESWVDGQFHGILFFLSALGRGFGLPYPHLHTVDMVELSFSVPPRGYQIDRYVFTGQHLH